MDTWRDVGKVLKLWIRLVKIRFWGENSSFSGWDRGQERGRERKSPRLFSSILGVSSVGICRVKS